MARTADIFSSSIIAVGDFNPAIFSPDWLERNELIGKDDGDRAREGGQGGAMLVSHQVSTFETEWFVLQVLENRFSLTSQGALSPAFKDLAVGILQLLPHTPVRAVGLNFMAHYKLVNENEYQRFGDVLAPKEIWRTLYPNQRPGLEYLTIHIAPSAPGQPVKTNDAKRISVQPSNKLKFGVLLSYNDHHDLSAVGEHNSRPAERVVALIDNEWESAWQEAVRVFGGIVTMVLEK